MANIPSAFIKFLTHFINKVITYHLERLFVLTLLEIDFIRTVLTIGPSSVA